MKHPRLLGAFSGLATFQAQAYFWASVYSKAKILHDFIVQPDPLKESRTISQAGLMVKQSNRFGGMSDFSKILEFYLFADDTSIYFDSDDVITLQKTVNKELRKIKKWLDANRLALNITKTNYVIFHSP